jgi:hypothetical protein
MRHEHMPSNSATAMITIMATMPLYFYRVRVQSRTPQPCHRSGGRLWKPVVGVTYGRAHWGSRAVSPENGPPVVDGVRQPVTEVVRSGSAG